MSNAWVARNVRLNTKEETLGVAGEKTVVSTEWKISGDMAYGGIRLLVKPGVKSGSGAISIVLQTKIPLSSDVGDSGNWSDVKSVNMASTPAPTYIILNPNVSGDEVHFPLGTLCRVVVNCAAATTLKIGDVVVASEA